MVNRAKSMVTRIVVFVLIGCGWLLSGWLLLLAFSLGIGRFGGGAFLNLPYCRCDEILASSSSLLLNVPIAGWGFLYFAVLACLLIIQTSWSNRVAMLLAGLGSGVSLVLSTALLASSVPVCTLCLLVHATNLGVLAALCVLTTSEPPPDGPGLPFFRRLRLATVLVAVLLGGAVQGAILKPANDVLKASDGYKSAHQFRIPVLRDDPALGSSKARVQIVVFSSFQCPGCRAFAREAHRLTLEFPEAIQIVFKNYPLGKECNPDLVREMQPRACAAAFAAEAARRQGQFWQYHDAIFFHSSMIATEPELNRIARASGLDIERWESDRRSREIEFKVKDDIGIGHRLGIIATPAIFLDGRQVPEVRLPILVMLIKREIDQAGPESQISSR
jgi:protein-disulfide isomerase